MVSQDLYRTQVLVRVSSQESSCQGVRVGIEWFNNSQFEGKVQGGQQIKQKPFPKVTEACSKEEQITFPGMRWHRTRSKANSKNHHKDRMHVGFRNAIGRVFRCIFKYLKMHMVTSKLCFFLGLTQLSTGRGGSGKEKVAVANPPVWVV